jgi:isopentenyl-diphosphate delta-isomerase
VAEPFTDVAGQHWNTVELVDDRGKTLGVADVTRAHTTPSLLHRAFSVLLVDRQGQLLLQRRAAIKSRFAGCWSNSCCGHPPPGTDVFEAAGLRTLQELGVRPVRLRGLSTIVYRASDPQTGLEEHEFDHVLLGEVDEPLAPSPAEVAEVRWVSRAASERLLATEATTPWLPLVVRFLDRQAWR